MTAANPATFATQIDRAGADLAAGRHQEAAERVRALMEVNPGHPRVLGLLGQIAVCADQPALGLAALQQAVARDPRLEHRIWLALCLAKLDCRADAVLIMTEAMATMSPTPNGYFAVGMVLYALDKFDDAAGCFARCIALDTKRADARHRHARALQAAGKTEAAVEGFRDAIQSCGASAAYYTDLGGALSDLGRFDEAYAACTAALDRDPTCIVAQNNLGHALLNLNRGAEAVLAYDKAIDLCDSYAKAQFGQALARLKCGDFEHGWRQYEWRWRDSQTPRADLGVPLWNGEALGGRTILLHAEQGLGDTLQFVRFAPLVAARGGRVVLEVPAELARLLRSVTGVAEVIACRDPIPPIDLHCPMASLPMMFDLRLETIPALPYLPIALPQASRRRAADFVVGLVWAGDPRPSEPRLNSVDRRRSMTLEQFGPLLDVHGVRFVSFQFGEARGELAAWAGAVADAMSGVVDFADTAVRLLEADLLISVDTSMVHLAGGIGIPVWMLSRFDGCWRWLERRDDSPWYPSLRIFRQTSPGDWSSVVTDVRTALRQIAAGRRSLG